MFYSPIQLKAFARKNQEKITKIYEKNDASIKQPEDDDDYDDENDVPLGNQKPKRSAIKSGITANGERIDGFVYTQ
jgi:hypothetical protein